MSQTEDAIKKLMTKAWDDIIQNQPIAEAVILEKATDTPFNKIDFQYFVGDPDAEVVMVQLNARCDANKIDQKLNLDYDTFDEHYNFFRNFGTIKYGANAKKKHDPKFDKKVALLFEASEIMHFSTAGEHELSKVEYVMNKKFQIELVPYGSPKFKTNKMPLDLMQKYMDQTLELISLKKRKVIIFGGGIFHDILKKGNYYKGWQAYREPLEKKDGSKGSSGNIIKGLINYKGQIMETYVLSTFPKQGLNQESYGKFLKKVIEMKITPYWSTPNFSFEK